MEQDAREWLTSRAAAFLRRAGLEEGQTVLDFGCNEGNYAAPAARVVGEAGRVYALDKDAEAVQALREASRQKGLDNVECLRVAEDGRLPLPAGSVDAVLLYDVLHRGYFPERERRMKALGRIYRVLRPKGVLSFYPTHLKKFGMTFERALAEVRAVGFKLIGVSRRRLVHNGHLTRGRLFTFRKSGGPGKERAEAGRAQERPVH